MARICDRCGTKVGFGNVLTSGNFFCRTCTLRVEEEEKRESRERRYRIKQAADKIIVTTTPSIDGYHVRKYLGVESVEYVIGTGVFSELSSGINDFFGRRSSAFEQKLQTAKKNAMDGFKMIAAKQGANAIIGLDLDYS